MQQSLFCPICNFEILIIPDLKAVSIAIEEHLLTHENTNLSAKLKGERDIARNVLLQDLVTKILLIKTPPQLSEKEQLNKIRQLIDDNRTSLIRKTQFYKEIEKIVYPRS